MHTSRIRLAVVAAGALLAAGALAGESRGEPFSMLSLDEVEKLVGTPGVTIVDANPEEVFRKNHVPGARWYRAAPMSQLLPAGKDRPVVFYCANPH